MISLSWFWFGITLWAVGCLGGILGFALCAVLTMAKHSDQAIEDMHN